MQDENEKSDMMTMFVIKILFKKIMGTEDKRREALSNESF